MSSRTEISAKKRWVIKVGSALLTNDGQGLDQSLIGQFAKQIAFLREQGIEAILVSSGAVAAGVSQLGFARRPDKMNELQAAAAVGQAYLVRNYQDAFAPYDIQLAQVLLTHADISNRMRYLNARSTLTRLLDLKVLTVVNENDSVATDEICFGDNDNLAALVANLVGADLLIILTDQNGLYTADPRSDETATLLHEVNADDQSLLKMASGGTSLGRGGMVTKLLAAQNASRSGASTIIANGREANILERLYAGEQLGTLLLAKQRMASKKQWLAGQMRSKGSVTLDQGAISVLKQKGSSLLPIGVVSVSGDFERGELINCLDQQGNEVAKGLANYSALEANKLKGKSSDKISQILGYPGDDELVHRDNMVVL